MSLKEDTEFVLVSKALDNFSKVTVCTLRKAIIKYEISFTLVKFTFPLKWVLRTEVNSLFLVTALVLLIRKISRIINLIY